MTSEGPAGKRLIAPLSSEISTIAAAVIGNILIWFDIALFGFLALPISKSFFPSGEGDLALLLTLGTFAASFVVRPIGSIILGAYADRHGRKASLLLSIRLIACGTALIAFMPSYDHAGMLAPLGVLVARCIQGFAAGGEYGSSTAYLAEISPGQRGWLASLQTASQAVSGMMAAAFGAALSNWLDPASLVQWGWRLPFVFGLLVVPIGYYLRVNMRELSAPEPQNNPAAQLIRTRLPALMAGIGLLAVCKRRSNNPSVRQPNRSVAPE